MTQQEVGDFFGISKGAVAQWESESEEYRTRPDHDKMLNLSKLLNVNFDWLFGESDDMRFVADARKDVIDLIPNASPDTEKKLTETLGALERAIEEGAIRETDIDVLASIIGAARARQRQRFGKS